MDVKIYVKICIIFISSTNENHGSLIHVFIHNPEDTTTLSNQSKYSFLYLLSYFLSVYKIYILDVVPGMEMENSPAAGV